MIVYCKDCGDVPLTYITIGCDTLCLSCAKQRYEKEIKKINEKYSIFRCEVK